MPPLPRKWAEILENLEFHRERRVRYGTCDLPAEAAIRPIFERLAEKWAGRVKPSFPGGPLFQFGRKAKIAPGELALRVCRIERGMFVIVLEIESHNSYIDNEIVEIELCSPSHVFEVLDALFHDLEGSEEHRDLAEGWETIDQPGDRPAKFWTETEQAWQTSPTREGLASLPPPLRERKAWRVLCRWVPGAVALLPCPCIQDLGTLFQGDRTSLDPTWEELAEQLRPGAMSRCTMVSSACLAHQIWILTEIAPIPPWTLLSTVASILGKIPAWIEDRRGTAAGSPARLTFEALTKAAFHDVVGNPYRPVYPEPVWLAANDHAVVNLARQIDEERDYTKLGILADALQDAGCDNQALLDHCREDGLHGPGCWVIDTLLGRMYSRS